MQIQRSFFPKLISIAALFAALVISGCGTGGQQSTSNVASSAVTPAASTTPAPSANANVNPPSQNPASPTPSAPPTPPTPQAPPPSASGVPHSSHVFLVIEENKMFSEVYPNGMPWLAAQGGGQHGMEVQEGNRDVFVDLLGGQQGCLFEGRA